MKQGNFENEEFIRVGTTLYKLVNQPRLNAHRVEQRNTAAGLRQGLSRHRAEVRRLLHRPRPCGLPSRGGQVPEPLRADRTPSATRRVSLYPVIGAPYLR